MAGSHVALLRGINVGRAKRVAMADLRALVEELGYTDVRTLLNSGNVAFTVPDAPAKPSARARDGAKVAKAGAPSPASTKQIAERVERAVLERTGVSSRVTVLTKTELDEVLAANPLGAIADDPTRLLVAVLNDPADRAKLEALAAKQDWSPDVFEVGARAGYVWFAEGILASKLGDQMLRALGDSVTTRNWATMTKLRALLEA